MNAYSTSAKAHFLLGKAYLEAGDRQAALDCFDRAIALSPGIPEFYHMRGRVNAELNGIAKALEDYYRAAKLFFLRHDLANYEAVLQELEQRLV